MSFAAEFDVIHKFYGDKTAKRSGVPLMNHIIEGVQMLDIWGRSDLEKAAFCLHPIVQNDEDVDVEWSLAYPLACEYRDRANSYLCRPETDWVRDIPHVYSLVGEMSEGCAYLLLADKVQNQKDFLIYHSLTHERRFQLMNYFNVWIKYLVWEIESNAVSYPV